LRQVSGGLAKGLAGCADEQVHTGEIRTNALEVTEQGSVYGCCPFWTAQTERLSPTLCRRRQSEEHES
jgi:hypothetical protein